MAENPKVPQIDLDKVFKEKNPGLYRFLPRFIINLIKKIVHQDELNLILEGGLGLQGGEFSDFVLEKLNVKLIIKGLENIPSTGNFILVANHPLGGIDGVSVTGMIWKIRRDFKFIVNDILYLIPNYKKVFIPVNKLGINTKTDLENIEKIYASQEAVVIFPAGFCSRKIRGKILDTNWNKSFINKSLRYKRDVIPILVNAKNSNMFYNIATLRKWLGIKANIEMFLLPHEMFVKRGKTIEIIVGKPIKHEIFSDGKSLKWAETLRYFVYELEKNPNADILEFVNKKKK